MRVASERAYFIRLGVEWDRIASALRAAYPAGDGPLYALAVGLRREIGWLHLLYAAGLHTLLLEHLRLLTASAGGLTNTRAVLDDAGWDLTPAEVVSVAGDVLGRVRALVAACYPAAFASARRPA